MGTSRTKYKVESQTRAVVELDAELNFATGNAPTVVAQNDCMTVTRTGAGAYTIQLKSLGGANMAPAYGRLLNKHSSWSDASNNHVRWGNYSKANGTLTFTIHADGATATAAADPANNANLNLNITLRFKDSDIVKN